MWRMFFLSVNFVVPPFIILLLLQLLGSWMILGGFDVENLFFWGSIPPSPSLHLLIIIVVVGLLDDFLWFGCGESFFLCIFGVDFSAFHLLIILVDVEFLDDFFGCLSFVCFCVYCEKCGGVSFSASACSSSSSSSSSLLFFVALSSFFLFCLNLIFRMCASFQSCVRAFVRVCFPANFVDRVVLT